MDLQATTRLTVLKAAHETKTNVALTRDEILLVLKMRQGDQMSFIGVDSEFEVAFALGVADLHKALRPPKPKAKKKPRQKKKAAAKVSAPKKARAGGDEIIVRNEAGN